MSSKSEVKDYWMNLFWLDNYYEERKTVVYLSAGGTETVLICPDTMPAEAADLVSTCAGEEVDIINF